jgi:hypothetical protein
MTSLQAGCCDNTLAGAPSRDIFVTSRAAKTGTFKNVSSQNACIRSLNVGLVNGQVYALPLSTNRIDSQ